jgi:hypothetical protein
MSNQTMTPNSPNMDRQAIASMTKAMAVAALTTAMRGV